MVRPESGTSPRLSGVVVQWGDAGPLARLASAWPVDGRFELIVIDNGGPGTVRETAGKALAAAGARLIEPGRNLGFAAAVNAGVAAARAPLVLLLNPDACPRAGALEALLRGFSSRPDAAGLVPRLVGPEGASQHRWQLRRLPSATALLAQTLLLPFPPGARAEPAPGTPVEQPAAAALALRREALEAVGGLDPGFYPAWFEDVDLAARLAALHRPLLYWPEACFEHRLGSTVPQLGYGPFLWIYYRNLVRYLRLHHGAGATRAAHLLIPIGMLLRLCLLPLRRPGRAGGRGEAARGLLAVVAGAVTGWRRPRRYATSLLPPAGGGGPGE